MWEISISKIEGHETYGIKIGNTIIDDISLDRAEIEEFVERLNRCEASEIHAPELVEDFLNS